MSSSIYSRYRIGIFAIFLLTVPLIIISAKRAVENSSTQVAEWLPESFEPTQRLKWFQKHFVSDDLLMISWEGCTFDDPRLPALAKALRAPVKVGDEGSLVLSRQVITGPEVLQQLREEPLELSRRAALLRLRGWLTDKEYQTTCMVVLLSIDGWTHRHFLFDHIYECANAIEGLGRESLHIGGTTADSVAVDHASQEGLQLNMILCFSIGCLLMILMFRSLVMTATVFITALYCQQLSLSVVDLTGGHMDSVMLMIPSLLYVLTISAGVHLANYYFDAVRERGLAGAPRRAVQHALLPCVLASATTALGLGSLGVSFLIPVRNFGIYATIGVILATGVVFLLIPTLLEQFPVPQTKGRGDSASSGSKSRGWDWLIRWVANHSGWVLIASVFGLAASVWGVTQIHAGARVHDLFSEESTILQDYDWLESHIGPLVPLEVVVRIPKIEGEPNGTIMDRLRVVGAVHAVIENYSGVGAVVSPLNFSPRIRRRGSRAQDVFRESLLNKQLERNRSQFTEMNLLRETPTEELWRVSARAYAGDALDFSTLLVELQAAVEPVLDRCKEIGMGDVRAVYCGAVPLVQKAQEQMLFDLINSFLLAFGLITVMMIGLAFVGASKEFAAASNAIYVVRICALRIMAGLVSMIPNVLPCSAVIGGMGLMGVSLEIGSMMTASVALGIAVDDTLHFITWFRRGLNRGQTRPEAVRHAFAHCATAMTQTSLICGLGLLVFGFSDFVPIARFAWVMFAMLAAALIADLVVLPAMLLSPLGASFEPFPPSNQAYRDKSG